MTPTKQTSDIQVFKTHIVLTPQKDIPFPYLWGVGALHLPENDFFFPKEDTHFNMINMKTSNYYGLTDFLEGIAVETIYSPKIQFGQKNKEKIIIYGKRSLLNLHQSGFEMEGRVSILGKKLRAFTSSMLVEVEEKLINVATLYVVRRGN